MPGVAVADDIAPTDPEDEGIETPTPDLPQIEAARLLANSSRDRLRSAGLTDDQIDDWAYTFIEEEGGTADTSVFVDWIERRQT